MFHDIQDMSTWHLGNWSGGVPAFWAMLTKHVHAHRALPITFQISEGQPVFGIGILQPDANGLAVPDIPIAQWRQWEGRGKGNLLEHFCQQASPPVNFARACQMLDQAKY